MATVYKFYNCVALNAGNSTVYIPPVEAAKLARAMLKLANAAIRNDGSDIASKRVASWSHEHFAIATQIAEYEAKGLISCEEHTPNNWRARYRLESRASKIVRNASGLPIDYASPTAALEMALEKRERDAS